MCTYIYIYIYHIHIYYVYMKMQITMMPHICAYTHSILRKIIIHNVLTSHICYIKHLLKIYELKHIKTLQVHERQLGRALCFSWSLQAKAQILTSWAGATWWRGLASLGRLESILALNPEP